jgi:hypothetical protein
MPAKRAKTGLFDEVSLGVKKLLVVRGFGTLGEAFERCLRVRREVPFMDV